MIISHHPGIWKFLEHIQRDQNENEILMIQLQGGHTRIRYPMKGQYKRNMEQVERIVGNYQNFKDANNVRQYLLSISYKLKLYSEEEPEEEVDDQVEQEE